VSIEIYSGFARFALLLHASCLKIRQRFSVLADLKNMAFPIGIVHRPYNSVGDDTYRAAL